MSRVIDCVSIANEVKARVKERIEAENLKVTLAVVHVECDQASAVYVRNKKRACEAVGITSRIIRLANNTTEDELLGVIDMLNKDANINGILVQLPLPEGINELNIIHAIAPEKDVDGLHPTNMGKLMAGDTNGLFPCTPSGVIEVLEQSVVIDTFRGAKVAMVGASNLVGKPLGMMLTNMDATVTICNVYTPDIASITREADIVILATGNAKLFGVEYFRDDAIVIDVGINRDENGKLCGDVDFANVVDNVGHITPVPKGIGVMTVAMLMQNTLRAYFLQQ